MNSVTLAYVLSFCSKIEFIYVILIILQQCNFASNDKLNCAISSAEFDVEKLHFEAEAAYFVSKSKRKDFLTYRWDKKYIRIFVEFISFATNINKNMDIFVCQIGLIFFLVIWTNSWNNIYIHFISDKSSKYLYTGGVHCTFHVWYERFEAYSLNCVIQIQ